MAMSYGPQAAQVNEKPPLRSFLDLTLMQHSRDEDFEPRKLHVRFEFEPPRT
jgi:hypothetical protein